MAANTAGAAKKAHMQIQWIYIWIQLSKSTEFGLLVRIRVVHSFCDET